MRGLFILLICCLFTQFSYAQGTVSNPLQESELTPEEQIEEMLGAETEKPRNIKDYTDAFYENCASSQHSIMSGKDLAFLCRCAATKFSQEMTVENIEEIQKGTSEGSFQKLRLLNFVYQPCIEAPLYAMISKSCISNKKNRYLMQYPEATCACVASGVARKIKDAAPQFIQGYAKGGYQDRPPLELLIGRSEFERNYTHFSKLCVRKFEKR